MPHGRSRIAAGRGRIAAGRSKIPMDGQLWQPRTGMANPDSREVLHSLRAASLAPPSDPFLGDWLQAKSLLLRFYMLPNIPTS